MTKANDMVYRQAVIDDIDEWIDIYGENKCVDAQAILKQVKRSIKNLPAAQPEKRTEERTETHACDLISRAMLLEYIHNEPVGKMLCDKYNLDGVIKQLPSAQPDVPDKNVRDMISRQSAIQAINEYLDEYSGLDEEGYHGEKWCAMAEAKMVIENLPSAQPEQLTDKEQRIFLAAMGREEEVCKQVDEECRDCCEPYEDSLVRTCHEITRKVKGALWTI